MSGITSNLAALTRRLQTLERSIKRLERAEPDNVEYLQDSVISRFKILIESTWKNLAITLSEQGFVDASPSPKGVVNFAYEAKLISQQERDDLVKYLLLRNVASHIYDQPQYVLVVTAAPEAPALVKILLDRMQTGQATIA